jgi:hypothetical protein
MSVLILAADIDATADKMVRTLADRDVVVHRVNTAWFPRSSAFPLGCAGKRTRLINRFSLSPQHNAA